MTIKTTTNNSSADVAPRAGAMNADTSSATFRDSLRDAASTDERPGTESITSSGVGIRADKKTTHARDANGQNASTSKAVSSINVISTSPELAPTQLSVTLQSSELISPATTSEQPVQMSVESTLFAPLSEEDGDSIGKLEEFPIPRAYPSTLPGAAAQVAPQDISSPTGLSADMQNVPAEKPKFNAASSTLMVSTQSADTSQPGTPQKPQADPSHDHILSAIRDVAFDTTKAPALPLIHASASLTAIGPPATMPIVSLPIDLGSTALSVETPLQTETNMTPASFLRTPIDRNRLNRADAPSGAGTNSLRKTADSAKPIPSEIGDISLIALKRGTEDPSGRDSSQQSELTSVENKRDIPSAGQPMFTPSAFSAMDASDMPSFAPSADSFKETHRDSARPQATAPPEQASVAGSLSDTSMALNSVKLLQRLGQAEMTIGMHSAEFGSISIRASNVRDQLAAEVSLDHIELSKVLLSHLPEMQSTLNGGRPLDLRIVSTTSSSESSGQGSFSGNTSQGSDQRAPRAQSSQNLGSVQTTPRVPLAESMAEIARTARYNNRLDVRA